MPTVQKQSAHPGSNRGFDHGKVVCRRQHLGRVEVDAGVEPALPRLQLGALPLGESTVEETERVELSGLVAQPLSGRPRKTDMRVVSEN